MRGYISFYPFHIAQEESRGGISNFDEMTTNLLKVIELLLQLLLLRTDLRERQLHFFHFFIQARDPPWSGVVGMWKRECEG